MIDPDRYAHLTGDELKAKRERDMVASYEDGELAMVRHIAVKDYARQKAFRPQDFATSSKWEAAYIEAWQEAAGRAAIREAMDRQEGPMR